MKKITNQDFAEKTGYKYQTVRRWSREIFGIDPTAGQSSGVAREYTPEEAFLLYLAAHLINQRKVSIPNTRIIIKEIKPWLDARGYFPLAGWRENHVVTVEADGTFLTIDSWSILLLFYDNGEICIQAIGGEGPQSHEGVGEFEGDPIRKEYRIYKDIISNCEGNIINTVEVGIGGLINEFTLFVLG